MSDVTWVERVTWLVWVYGRPCKPVGHKPNPQLRVAVTTCQGQDVAREIAHQHVRDTRPGVEWYRSQVYGTIDLVVSTP